MTSMEPMDGNNLSDNFICPRCGTSLPPTTTFCSACGRRVKEKNEEGIAYPEKGDAEAHEQEDDITVRLPSLREVHIKQQITKPVSIANAAHQQIVSMLGSSNGSMRNGAPLMESTKDLVDMKLTSDETPTVPVVSVNNSASAESLSKTWGWLPTLSLISAIGVFLVALAYNASRVASQWSEPLFWLGLIVLYLPIAARLFLSQPTRRERLALLIVLDIALYCVKFLQYPLYFAFFDEFIHVRSAQDILATGHLFQPNPILSLSPFYPGLEIVTTALSNLTGLSIFASGTILIGLVQLVLVLSLYFFYERFTLSAQMAGIATVLYMVNPGFTFDMDFAYESLALSLAIFFLFVVVLRCHSSVARSRGLTLMIWLALGAIVITHHLTSFALVAFLLVWTILFILLRAVAHFRRSYTWKDRVGPSPGGVALLGLVLCVAWLTYTGGLAIGYLAQYPIAAIHQLIQILNGESGPEQLFQGTGGLVIPLWQRAMSYASVGLILLGLPFGLFQIWRRHRTNALFLALAVAALAYPASLVFRLTAGGAEGSERASEFVFVGVAIVLALGATTFWLSRASHWWRTVMIMGAVGVIFLGQFIVGNGQVWARMPGPYMVVADNRSIEPQGIAAAEWADTYLGPGKRIATDRINTLLMTTYGHQWDVDVSNSNTEVSSVFTSPQFGSAVEAILQQDDIQYLVVDRRLSTGIPQIQRVFDILLPGPLQSKPIDPAALAKFNGVPNVSRVFDSGDIIIYDVEPIANGASAIPTPTPQLVCASTSSTTTSSSYPTIVKNYTGILYDIAAGKATKISLTGIQQKQGVFCGSLSGMPTNTHGSQVPSNGPFKGTITTAGQIQFILTSGTGQATASFTGFILPDGGMTGTYCSSGVGTGTCSDYGLWSVAPAQSG